MVLNNSLFEFRICVVQCDISSVLRWVHLCEKKIVHIFFVWKSVIILCELQQWSMCCARWLKLCNFMWFVLCAMILTWCCADKKLETELAIIELCILCEYFVKSAVDSESRHCRSLHFICVIFALCSYTKYVPR